jgi:cell division septation protein DedD
MAYQVLLDRRSIAVSLLGFAAVGTLLFLGGFLVAARWYEDRRPERAQGVRGSTPTLSQSALGWLESSFTPTVASSRSSQRQEPIRDGFEGLDRKPNAVPIAVAYAPAPLGEAPDALEGMDGTQASTAEPVSSDMAGPSSEVSVANEAPTRAPDYFSADVSYQEEPDAYSVQAGAFLSEFNLESFVDELESSGYEPYVVKMSNADRVLLSVRIGKFSTREEAQRAASAFATKFGRSAVVREPVSP